MNWREIFDLVAYRAKTPTRSPANSVNHANHLVFQSFAGCESVANLANPNCTSSGDAENSQTFATDSQAHDHDAEPRFAEFARFAKAKGRIILFGSQVKGTGPGALQASKIVSEPSEEDYSNDLSWWLSKVRQATTPQAVLRIVEDFRPLDWTDEHRAEMSKAYIAMIEHLCPP